MQQEEEKELLLKDLYARLPYGVICYWRNGSELTLNLTEYNGHLTCINKVNEYYYCHFNVCNNSNNKRIQNKDVPVEIVMPYLRPLSSMTEEEEKEYINIDNRSYSCPINYAHIPASERIDWLIANHFDYRGLIPRGLALEAPDGMYNLNEK